MATPDQTPTPQVREQQQMQAARVVAMLNAISRLRTEWRDWERFTRKSNGKQCPIANAINQCSEELDCAMRDALQQP